MALLSLNAGSVPTEESMEWKTLHTALTTPVLMETGARDGHRVWLPPNPVTEASSDASLAAHQTNRRNSPRSQHQLLLPSDS